MNQPAAYTPLESLFLFQSLLAHGVDTAAFARTSELLKGNALIKGSETYDPSRLSPDALQQLFLLLLRDELRSETDRAPDGASDANSPGSPGSRKRKLASPPLPSLADAYEQIDKVPALVDRLYARYRDHVVKQVREDERRFEAVQKEIQLLERSERERLVKAASSNGAGSGPTPTIRDGKLPVGGIKKGPTSNTPVLPPKPPTPGSSTTAQVPVGATPMRPTPTGVQPPAKPVNGSGAALQPPQGLTMPTAGVPQLSTQVSKPAFSSRPDLTPKSKDIATTAQPTAAESPPTRDKPLQAQNNLQAPAQPSDPRQAPTTGTPGQQMQKASQLPGRPLQPVPGAPTAGQSQAAIRTPQTGSVLAPPQTGQLVPPQVGSAGRGAAVSTQSGRPTSTTPADPSGRPIQPPQPPALTQQVPRPVASAAPIQLPTGAATATPLPRGPLGQTAQLPSGISASGSPAPRRLQIDKPANLPLLGQHQPKPPIPEHMIRQAMNTPKRVNLSPSLPQTPQPSSPSSLTRGFGTKWASHSTPSTPGPIAMEPESPAYEPVSPPQRPAIARTDSTRSVSRVEPPKSTQKLELSVPKPGRGRPPRHPPKGRGVSTTPSTRRSQSVTSQTDELSMDYSAPPRIKKEESTPRPHDDAGDTTADESVHGRRLATPGSVSSRLTKRKRQETPPDLPTPLTHVLWTRGFTKVSSSALDQISSHRDANMFATALRERDAPNYRQIVLQPQDITSIRAAIKQGNKAAILAASSLPGGDPGTASVWLPVSDDLIPPKGIINSSHLERELVHMFCNAIMYNPDPDRGPGPAFMRRDDDEEDGVVGYRLDEDGVVKNTRAMFLEVEKLLGDLRSAEKQRGAPPVPGTTRPASVATPADNAAEEEDELAADGEVTSGTVKRRRISTRG